MSNSNDDLQSLINLGCDLGRKLNSMIDAESAATIGRRLTLLAKAQFYPPIGPVDAYAVAAFTNRCVHAVQQQAVQHSVPSSKPARNRIYQLEDFVKCASKRKKRQVPGAAEGK